ncbi:hypothetical protein RADP37_01679a [Roseomonas mucosa]|uniref:Insertion element IS402-like domain-containing protein n=2 Tax=Roseomonas mucosa TaxID=207340 RepID=A0A4Y1MV38_9PROT|nr:transposase [Roseomonas mucosa]AWV21751.1 hypothetical protein RADP37_01679a [Roseomonas mucosa]MDT8354885.1 transposase [Roseomonas mucosa]MDU7521719.1 transposase [Roseomonas mucosa]
MRASSFPTPHPFHPMTKAEWRALAPYLPTNPTGTGRPADHRHRLDAIFHVALPHSPWSALPERFGNPGTVARHFRRLTHAGLWQRLLTALATTPPGHPLHALAHRVCRAARRAHRILGLGLILLARRLDLRAALPGPPWLLPDPDLSQTLARAKLPPFTGAYGTVTPYRRLVRGLAALHRAAAGRARIPRSLRLGWA